MSVRTFVIGVLTAGSWLGWRAREAREQRNTVRTIMSNGGEVYYDYEFRDGAFRSGGSRPWPPTFYEVVGDDFFHCVKRVEYPTLETSLGKALAPLVSLRSLESLELETEPDHSGMVGLVALAGLQRLSIARYRAGDQGAVQIGKLTGLKELRLGGFPRAGSGLTEKGFESLAQLTDLEILDLGAHVVSDASWPHLMRLKKLRELRVVMNGPSLVNLTRFSRLRALRLDVQKPTLTQPEIATIANLPALEELSLLAAVNDDDLAYIARHAHLRRLHVLAPTVTGAGILELIRIKELQDLALEEAYGLTDADLTPVALLTGLTTLKITAAGHVTDGFRRVAGLQNLQVLDFSRAVNLNDAGLVHLRELKALRALVLSGTGVTPSGAIQLQSAMPALEIIQ